MFQDGVKKTILSASRAQVTSLNPTKNTTVQYRPERPTSWTAVYSRSNPCWPQTYHSAHAASSMRKIAGKSTGFLRFPFSNFRYSLTLFSKFFASFPHGTCALSVFHSYLALDGIYHPLRAAIPNNSTRQQMAHYSRWTGVSPSLLPSSKGLDPLNNAIVYRSQFGTSTDSQHELLSVQSPLLRES